MKTLAALLLGFAHLANAQDSIQRLSAERQRVAVAAAMSGSIQKQMASAGHNASTSFFLTPASLPAPAQPTDDCEVLSAPEVKSLATRAATANQVSPELVKAVMRQESGFRPCAVSNKGASGLMQLMPETAADLGVADVFNPEQNAFGGAQLLRQLLDRYAGNVSLALGAYNAGPARVDEWGGIPPIAETQHYVDGITRQISEPALPSGHVEPW